MKVLIFGTSGMLAWKIISILVEETKINITSTIRSNSDKNLIKKKIKNSKNLRFIKFDASNYKQKSLKNLINKYDVIVNCIGVIKPNINESDNFSVINTIKVNSIFPRDLCNLKTTRLKVLQIATDCVFDGTKGNYDEDSLHNPTDIYGKSKSLGEANSKNFYNLRCSIIGEEIKNKKSLINWFLKHKEKSALNGFSNHKWNGITTTAFAKIIKAIIINRFYQFPRNIHILPKRTMSKFTLLNKLNLHFKKKYIIHKALSNNTIDRSLKSKYKIANTKIWKLAGYKKIPSIENLISEI